jgi:hypothetical protein
MENSSLKRWFKYFCILMMMVAYLSEPALATQSKFQVGSQLVDIKNLIIYTILPLVSTTLSVVLCMMLGLGEFTEGAKKMLTFATWVCIGVACGSGANAYFFGTGMVI